METLEDGRLPTAEQLGMEVVFAAKLRLAGGAGQEVEDDLGFELVGEGTSGA